MLAIVMSDRESEGSVNFLKEELEHLDVDLEGVVFKSADEVLTEQVGDVRCILAMSRDVAESLVQKKGTVKQLRGMHNSDTVAPIIVTYGPNSLIRTGYEASPYYPAFREDVQRAIDVSGIEKRSWTAVIAMVTDIAFNDAVRKLQDQIDKDDIIELEDEPHVTIKYGLHTKEASEVAEMLDGAGVVELKIGGLSLFESEHADVLKFDVESEKAVELHEVLSELENSDKHKQFNPHLTVAYLKSGTGSKYTSLEAPGGEFSVDKLIFSTADDSRAIIDLNVTISKDDEPLSKAEQVAFCNEILKAEEDEDDDFTFVLTPILVPESVDHQGDIISAEVIVQASHDYMEHSQRPGFMHRQMLGRRDAVMVESFITRSAMKIGKKTVKKGTWMGAWRVYNPDLRQMIRDGDLGGVSIGGKGIRESVST